MPKLMEINSSIICYNMTERGTRKHVYNSGANMEHLKLSSRSKMESYRNDNYIQEIYAPEFR
jgi:hypothetical protein